MKWYWMAAITFAIVIAVSWVIAAIANKGAAAPLTTGAPGPNCNVESLVPIPGC